MAETFRSIVNDVQGMQVVLVKHGEPCVLTARGDADVMKAERARRLGRQVQVTAEGDKVLSLNEIS